MAADYFCLLHFFSKWQVIEGVIQLLDVNIAKIDLLRTYQVEVTPKGMMLLVPL